MHWGNNLNLSPAQNYASQYRVTSNNALLSLSIPVAETDIPEGVEVEWTIDNSSSSISGGSIDEMVRLPSPQDGQTLKFL